MSCEYKACVNCYMNLFKETHYGSPYCMGIKCRLCITRHDIERSCLRLKRDEIDNIFKSKYTNANNHIQQLSSLFSDLKQKLDNSSNLFVKLTEWDDFLDYLKKIRKYDPNALQELDVEIMNELKPYSLFIDLTSLDTILSDMEINRKWKTSITYREKVQTPALKVAAYVEQDIKAIQQLLLPKNTKLNTTTPFNIITSEYLRKMLNCTSCTYFDTAMETYPIITTDAKRRIDLPKQITIKCPYYKQYRKKLRRKYSAPSSSQLETYFKDLNVQIPFVNALLEVMAWRMYNWRHRMETKTSNLLKTLFQTNDVYTYTANQEWNILAHDFLEGMIDVLRMILYRYVYESEKYSKERAWSQFYKRMQKFVVWHNKRSKYYRNVYTPNNCFPLIEIVWINSKNIEKYIEDGLIRNNSQKTLESYMKDTFSAGPSYILKLCIVEC